MQTSKFSNFDRLSFCRFQIIFLCFFLCKSQAVHSQRLKFEWSASPVIHQVCNESFKKESAVILTEKVQLSFESDKKEGAILTRRLHRIIKVIDEKGIELYNKISIAYYPEYPISEIKARSILPSGKVVELKADAFKELKEEDGNYKKIFALEGIEKGAEIEYMVTMKQPVKFYGNYVFQDYIPTCSSEFEILSPKHLLFEMKGYNGASIAKDTLFGEQHSMYGKAENLIGLEEEKMASYLPHFAQLDYSLAYNTGTMGSNIRILTWDEAAKNIYKNYFDIAEKDLKELKKLLSQNKEYALCSNNADKQEWIENYVKSNFVQQTNLENAEAESISFILKNKFSTSNGIKHFLVALYMSQDITFELGYTSNRMNKPFDYSFANWDNLKNCLFYFPDTKRYMAPNEFNYRMPFIPADWCNNYSMFCKVLKLGEVTTASAEKRLIPEFKAETNYHNHDVDVKFSAAMDSTIIQIKNTLGGLSALELMPIFVYLENEKRDDVAKDILRLNEKDDKMMNFKYENNQFAAVTKNKPLVISSTIYATNNLEKAGNKYIFHIGELIGRQSEMYQERTRQFDVDINNPHQYTRILNIHIPAGYKVNNLDKLNMNVIHNADGAEVCKFVSSYKLNGNVLEVTVFEVYHTSHTPKSEFENYSKVVNAAADFNKIVVIFEKI